jgi:ribosome-associated heat shock protein Hsp15
MTRKMGARAPARVTRQNNPPDELGRQRIDRWLWHARVVRTRGAAADLAGAGYVRVNGARVDAPGRTVRAGDVITVALDRTVRVLKVIRFAERRGPAKASEGLYEDLA